MDNSFGHDKTTLDLAKRGLKKVPKQEDAQNVRVLILNENELQKIDNIDSYLKIEKLSLCRNQLLRMYGVCRLHCLRDLNLSFNGILTIEGLKELVHLTHLNLEGNSIKTIEHLNTNLKLESLNLNENCIASVGDVSFLKCLKDLHLFGNRLTHLRQCDKYLPTSLETLNIAKNNIADLNEICTLSHLVNLRSIAIVENPCVQMTGGSSIGFDYRPFVLNWCMSLKVIDGYVVNPIESLKAEWLYSQGRGRQFRVGDQIGLSRYLSQSCPLSGETLESENERKLRLILSKAQQHQRQLQEEISSGTETNPASTNNSPSGRRKGAAASAGQSSRIQSPRFSRFGVRQGSPEQMSNSYHGNISPLLNSSSCNETQMQMTTSLIDNMKSDSIMTQSLDPTILNVTSNNHINNNKLQEMKNQLNAASKMCPVPESLMSPDCPPIATGPTQIHRQQQNNHLAQQSNHQKGNNSHTKKETSTSKMPNQNSSPKMSRNSPHLKRHTERSPILSPRRQPLNNSNHHHHHRAESPLNKKHNSPSPAEAGGGGGSVLSSDDDSDHINVDKLKTVHNVAARYQQKQQKVMTHRNNKFESLDAVAHATHSAIVIQKMWRGYLSRKKGNIIAEVLQKQRTQEYITQLANDVASTKVELNNEKKIQQLQMQAINALWKKLNEKTNDTTVVDATCPSSAIPTTLVHDLTKKITILTSQVQQLQTSMCDVVACMNMFCNLPQPPPPASTTMCESNSTQTEIVAVHTPHGGDAVVFPFVGQVNKVQRPSTLPLDPAERSESEAVEALEYVDDDGTNKEKPVVEMALPKSSETSPREFEGENKELIIKEN